MAGAAKKNEPDFSDIPCAPCGEALSVILNAFMDEKYPNLKSPQYRSLQACDCSVGNKYRDWPQHARLVYIFARIYGEYTTEEAKRKYGARKFLSACEKDLQEIFPFFDKDVLERNRYPLRALVDWIWERRREAKENNDKPEQWDFNDKTKARWKEFAEYIYPSLKGDASSESEDAEDEEKSRVLPPKSKSKTSKGTKKEMPLEEQLAALRRENELLRRRSSLDAELTKSAASYAAAKKAGASRAKKAGESKVKGGLKKLTKVEERKLERQAAKKQDAKLHAGAKKRKPEFDDGDEEEEEEEERPKKKARGKKGTPVAKRKRTVKAEEDEDSDT